MRSLKWCISFWLKFAPAGSLRAWWHLTGTASAHPSGAGRRGPTPRKAKQPNHQHGGHHPEPGPRATERSPPAGPCPKDGRFRAETETGPTGRDRVGRWVKPKANAPLERSNYTTEGCLLVFSCSLRFVHGVWLHQQVQRSMPPRHPTEETQGIRLNQPEDVHMKCLAIRSGHPVATGGNLAKMHMIVLPMSYAP